jgi:hypothetical protein
MKGPVENAAAEEIKKGGLRQLSLGDFHKLLGKHKTLSTFPTDPAAATNNKKCVTYVSERVLPMSPVHRLFQEGSSVGLYPNR